jgi:hypothetical protein
MATARKLHTATLLPNGKVLVAGGENPSYLSTAELYDPATGAFTATAGPMTATRSGHTATLLPNGKVLIAGGSSSATNHHQTAELYDPAMGTFTSTAALMSSARSAHFATLLASGSVLLGGGQNNSGFLATAELYDAGAGFSNVRRPVVSSLTNPLCQPANLALSGSLFTDDSEGAGDRRTIRRRTYRFCGCGASTTNRLSSRCRRAHLLRASSPGHSAISLPAAIARRS